MSVNVSPQGVVRVLDRVPRAPEAITDREVEDKRTLARILLGLIRDVQRLLGFWRPRRIDFEARVVNATGATKYRFEHRFGGSVRYWAVGWSGSAAPCLREHSDSDENTLVLTSTVAGTATIRVEEAG